MSNSEADAAAARIFGGGRFRTAAIIAFLLPAVALGACDNLWRDGGSDPEKAGQEMQKKTSDLYKKCVELAIDADVQADEERGHREPKTAQEITAEVMDPKRAARRILEKPTTPSDYETECVRPYLRGCLLPPERVKKVEEYVFRVNACPDPKKGCPELIGRISELRGQRSALRQAKNGACNKHDEEDCRYRFRQLEAVIDAIALNEIASERECLE